MAERHDRVDAGVRARDHVDGDHVADMYARLDATSRWLEWLGLDHRAGYPRCSVSPAATTTWLPTKQRSPNEAGATVTRPRPMRGTPK